MHKYNQYPPIHKNMPPRLEIEALLAASCCQERKNHHQYRYFKSLSQKSSAKAHDLASYDFLHSRLTFSIFLGWLCFRLRSRAY